MNSTETIVEQYYDEMANSLKRGSLNYDALCLADDAILVGPGEGYKGRKELKPLFDRFTSGIESFEIKRQVITDSTACTVIEYQTKLSPLKVEMCEWIELRNGKIVEFRVYFDTVAWGKATKKS